MSFIQNNVIEKDLEVLAKKILDEQKNIRIFLFNAEMGSGKTTFIKQLCKELGVKDNMSSPTYPIVNEYLTKTGNKVYHFDLYRIKNIEECMDLGMEDYLYSGNYCFVEWPEIANRLYPENHCTITIKKETEHSRSFEIK